MFLDLSGLGRPALDAIHPDIVLFLGVCALRSPSCDPRPLSSGGLSGFGESLSQHVSERPGNFISPESVMGKENQSHETEREVSVSNLTLTGRICM